MKKITGLILLFVILLMNLVGCSSLAKQFQWPFFEITKDGKTVGYLLGTNHYGKSEMYPFPESIKSSLKNSDVLVTETSRLDYVKDNSALVEKYKKAEPIFNKSQDDKTDTLLREKFTDFGINPNLSIGLSRYGIFNYISSSIYKTDPSLVTNGVDYKLFEENKSIKSIGLETFEEQMQILADAYNKDEEYSDLDFIKFIGTKEDAVNELDKFYELYTSDYYKDKDLGLPKFNEHIHDTLLKNRSIKWEESIIKMLEDGSNNKLFIAVGLMHVHDKDNIIELLEKHGLKFKLINTL